MFSREIPGYASRHRMSTGLTGWAQVNGLNGDTSIAERVRFDNYYIDNWSLRFDLKILAQTIGLMARAVRGTASPFPAAGEPARPLGGVTIHTRLGERRESEGPAHHHRPGGRRC